MAHVLAEDAKAYYNLTSTYGGTGTYGTPDWDEMTLLKDVTLNLDKDEVDLSVRASGGFKEFADGLIDGNVELSMLYDTSDAAFNDLQEAFLNKTEIEVAIMDGDITTTGSQGLRVTCMVKSFSRSETLGEALMASFTLRPRKNTNAAPAWYTVP